MTVLTKLQNYFSVKIVKSIKESKFAANAKPIDLFYL